MVAPLTFAPNIRFCTIIESRKYDFTYIIRITDTTFESVVRLTIYRHSLVKTIHDLHPLRKGLEIFTPVHEKMHDHLFI